jgi:uncharacterized protein YuzB (UPF0349 family)
MRGPSVNFSASSIYLGFHCMRDCFLLVSGELSEGKASGNLVVV